MKTKFVVLGTALLLFNLCCTPPPSKSDPTKTSEQADRSALVAASVKAEYERSERKEKGLVVVSDIDATALESALAAEGLQRTRVVHSIDQPFEFPETRFTVSVLEATDDSAKTSVRTRWGLKQGVEVVLDLTKNGGRWSVLERKVVRKS